MVLTHNKRSRPGVRGTPRVSNLGGHTKAIRGAKCVSISIRQDTRKVNHPVFACCDKQIELHLWNYKDMVYSGYCPVCHKEWWIERL